MKQRRSILEEQLSISGIRTSVNLFSDFSICTAVINKTLEIRQVAAIEYGSLSFLEFNRSTQYGAEVSVSTGMLN